MRQDLPFLSKRKEAGMDFNGAEAVVTGAAGGLRDAIARALHARGATGDREA